MKLFPAKHPWTNPVLCRINTDEGIYGYGETAISYGSGISAAFGMIKDLASLIVGMNPLYNEVIWEKLYKTTYWGQNGGPITYAGISAIDNALWDIKGKALGVPVHTLLGGKKRDTLRTYASQLQFGWGKAPVPAYSVSDFVLAAKNAVAEGYDALKIDFLLQDEDGRSFTSEDLGRINSPYYLNLMEKRLQAVRDAVGMDIDLIIESHGNTDANFAVQIGKMAEPYRIFYLEEPSTPSPDLTKYIADNINIPVASGERIYSRWQYIPYFKNAAIQVIQPDLGNCGGVTEVKKICDMSYAYDVGVQLHVCASPISIATSLQLEAVLPHFCIHEHHMINTADDYTVLGKYDYQPKNGYFSVPDLPGIGNELSDYALKTAEIERVDE